MGEQCRGVLYDADSDRIDSVLREQSIIDYTKTRGESLLLFLSFDICNSVELKRKTDVWVNLIDILYNENISHESKPSGMSFWKFNGDEVLFYCPVRRVHSIAKEIKSAYHHLAVLRQLMIDHLYSSETKKADINIDITATFWLARTSDTVDFIKKSADKGKPLNAHMFFDDNVDFIGQNIDEGFRLTKCSSHQKIAIDPKIIYFIYSSLLIKNEMKESDSPFIKDIISYTDDEMKDILRVITNTYFMGYQSLRGVWNNRLYPIYWYIEHDSSGSVKDIDYDDLFNGTPVKEIIRSENSRNADGDHPTHSKCQNVCKKLENIFAAVKEDAEILAMQGHLYEGSDEKKRIMRLKVVNANLYYSVACFNPASGNVLIARRCKNNTRRHLRGVWDFGNIKYFSVENIINEIIEQYKKNFGIRIDLITDDTRDNSIKPFGYSIMSRGGNPIHTILCHAAIIGLSTDEENSPYEEYDDETLLAHIYEFADKSLYEDFRIISSASIEDEYTELTSKEVELDYINAKNNRQEEFPENKTCRYFKTAIESAEKESITWNESHNALKI